MERRINTELSTGDAIAILEEKGMFDAVTRDRLKFVLERLEVRVVALPGEGSGNEE
jgi:hypothetical protein